MSADADVLYPMRDEAFGIAEDLAGHILENANSYHALAGQEDFPGRDRMRFAILLVMFEEMGKLMAMVQQCEKAAKADYESVRIEDYHNNCLNGRKAAAQIFEELRTVEKASMTLGKNGQGKMTEEPSFLREDFCTLQGRLLYFEPEKAKRKVDFVPPPEVMDRLAEIIERNTVSAGDYIHDLGKALGLWIQLGRKAKRVEGSPHALRYR